MNLRAHRHRCFSCVVTVLILAPWLALAQEEATEEFECPEPEEGEVVEDVDRRCLKLERQEQDDTADIDSDSTVDSAAANEKLFSLSGDFRPLANHLDRTSRSGETLTETTWRARVRFKAAARLTDLIGVGVRVAGRCATDECDIEWINDRSTPQQNGLDFGQFTFDEAYIHLFRSKRFDVIAGRQQTRMVLRGGVFSRSLDRNNSNNTNITWTDGVHFLLRRWHGWDGHVIVDHNAADGSGSVRRGQLDFTPSSARTSYYAAAENRVPVGPIVQRSISITHLPNALMVNGDVDGPRDSYTGVVGRMAFRWPMETDGPFFRGGFEVGYAPSVPTAEAANLADEVDPWAWNVTASIMDFRPRHNIGVFYGRTGAGWFLSPNFAHNEEQFEIRYQWRPRNRAAVDVRVRWREDLEQQLTAERERERFDAFLRLTWQFEMN